VLFPTPEADDITLAVLLTTSGGLVAGDRLAVSTRVGAGAAAHVTAAAAEKIYRSTGATTAVTQHLRAGEGAWLEYLPPETILFDGARLRRETRIELATGAGFLSGGILIFGRQARGERLTHGLVNERWEIWHNGALVWGDALHVDGDIRSGEGAWLEYLPPETILFDGARLRRETRIELATGAGFLSGGILIFGRQARGERLTHGLVNERWEIWHNGALVWGDALHVDGDI